MAEQSNPTTSRRRHHRRHRRNSRKRKLRNGVLIATIAVGMLTVLGLKLIGRGKGHQAEIVQRSYPVRVISVVDGDTFLGLDDGGDTLTYNVYSIEAPEIEQPQGYEARKYLYNMDPATPRRGDAQGRTHPAGRAGDRHHARQRRRGRSDAAFGICVVSQRYSQ